MRVLRLDMTDLVRSRLFSNVHLLMMFASLFVELRTYLSGKRRRQQQHPSEAEWNRLALLKW